MLFDLFRKKKIIIMNNNDDSKSINTISTSSSSICSKYIDRILQETSKKAYSDYRSSNNIYNIIEKAMLDIDTCS